MSYKDVLEKIDDPERRKWVGDRAEKALAEDAARRRTNQDGGITKASNQASEALFRIYREAKRKGEIDKKTDTARASIKTMRKVFAKIDQGN